MDAMLPMNAMRTRDVDIMDHAHRINRSYRSYRFHRTYRTHL